MNWKETIGTIICNYTKKHLLKFKISDRIDINLMTTWIIIVATIKGVFNQIIFRKTPENDYENESNIFKAWFCKTFAEKV